MTVLSNNLSSEEGLSPELMEKVEAAENEGLELNLPKWAEDHDFGEPLVVPEWEDVDSYRAKGGWHGHDLVHDRHAPVRILEYFVQWGNGEGTKFVKGGIGTTITGICHFTERAESHKGFCHGGSMCSLMDDVVGWAGFLTSGVCRPWTGFTVQINTGLKKPIRVDSVLLLRATITHIERRKVTIRAELVDPAEEEDQGNSNNSSHIHAVGEGLVVLNRGVLEEEPVSS